MKKFLSIVAMLIMMAFVLGLAGCGTEYADWPTGTLANLIPKIEDAKVTEVSVNRDDMLHFYVEADNALYTNYVEQIKSAGFTTEPETGSSYYRAYDQNGNYVNIKFSDEKLGIEVDAAMALTEMAWPTSTLAKMIPEPEYTKAKKSYDNTTLFSIYVDMAKDKISDYANKLIDAGFNINYSNSDKRFSGENIDGYKVTVEYHGFGITYISVKPVSESSSSTTEATTAAATTVATTAASSKSTSLRELADEYEKFVDSYISFMKSYNASDMSQLSKYQEFLSQYTEFLKKLAAVDTTGYDLSDINYYTEVVTRANQKISDAGIG